MIKYVLIGLFAFFTLNAQAQEVITSNDVKIGDIVQIGTPSGSDYQHIKFPKRNFIIKKGGIVDYKSIQGDQVVITDMEKTTDGITKIKVKRKDGRKFFRSVPVVSVHLEKAIAAGEVKL